MSASILLGGVGLFGRGSRSRASLTSRGVRAEPHEARKRRVALRSSVSACVDAEVVVLT
jgi:hypothetical protein